MSTPAVTPDKPLEFTLGDGTVVKAPNMEEAFKIVAKMKEDTAAALKTERDKATAAETERQRLADELHRKNNPQPANGNGPQFDKQHYYEMLNSDPMAAQDYLDAFRFGLKPEQVRPTFIQMNQDIGVVRQNLVVNQFTQQHIDDYPAGDANAAKSLTRRVEELVTQGYPFDVRTLNLAYGELVNEGTIKPNTPKTEDDQPTPPPSLAGPGGGNLSSNEMSRIENMSDKELEAFLRANGKLG